MEIIFDTVKDGIAGAKQLRAMLDAYIANQEPFKSDAIPRSEFTGEQLQGAYEAPMTPTRIDPVFQQNQPVVDGATGVPLGFQPGDLSGNAPSVAGAAQVPTAPVESSAGVPPPPTVVSAPAQAPTAPEAPASPSNSAPNGEGLDVTGLPWDKRIHSSSKAKNADGSWRKLRNLNDGALVAKVEAELRAATAGRPSGTQAALGLADIPAPATGAQVPPPPVEAAAPAVQVPPPPTVAEAGGTVAAPPAPAAPDVMTHNGFLEWVTPKMMDGSVTFENVAAALAASGVESLKALETNEAAVPAVYAALGGQ